MTHALSDLNILALDCQTTGANPDKGHLLEIGWVNARAVEITDPAKLRAESFLVSLPPETQIPRPVTRFTGIAQKTMVGAIQPERVWSKLAQTTRSVAEANLLPCALTVIHYARFEMPFLKALHHQYDASSPFPFQPICTHQITKKLLPGLPRSGLRAVAGYFGHSMAELKRSDVHAVATAIVWKHLAEILQTECGVRSLQQLLLWMRAGSRKAKPARIYPMDPQVRHNLVDKPGIYRMLRSNGDLLYVGKAKSLRQRINSYFRESAAHAEHILEMLTQARRLDVTLTASALEAAILESDQIKQHSPPYNIALRKRQREVVFFKKCLQQYSHAADANYPIGPLPSGNLCQALCAFATLLQDSFIAEDERCAEFACRLLGLPAEYAPEIDCLQLGIEAFRRLHAHDLPNQNALRLLTRMGAKFWRERMETQANDTSEEEENDAQQDTADRERVWTPDDVVRLMEGMTRHAAHMIRRARWFLQLSESSLAWQSPNAPAHKKIVIVFEKGDIVHRQISKKNQKLPQPPGYGNALPVRRQNFDVTVYDRLRVVTTEMRRLIQEQRDIELYLGHGVILRNPQLEGVLRWV
jgi:DNA polymerase-3 subunit epsilon